MTQPQHFFSGNEAMAHAALACGVHLATGYPGTPSTEICEVFSTLGGRAQWAPNEKVALEVGIGAAFGGANALVTMKHVGLNVAADPLFTCAYTGVGGGLVIVTADDPGLASSQNEQDNRHYARAAKLPMLEPADPQEAYDFMLLGFEISRRWRIPVLLRVTTRVCHSAALVTLRTPPPPPPAPEYKKDIRGRVMIPAYAKPAHRALVKKMEEIALWNDREGPNRAEPGTGGQGLVASGVSYLHAREAFAELPILKLGLTHPLPVETVRRFASGLSRLRVVEEGDPVLQDAIAARGIPVEPRPEGFGFGELNVTRVQKLVAGDTSPDPERLPGKPPSLCTGCPHRTVFELLARLGCIVAGDIGCYTLGVLPPFEAMDTCVCMGASIGTGLGLRHVLPPEQARRVVSVIGDSTFIHSGITGIVEMAYNPPATGHVVLILDNGTTAMTGLQEHPGTGRKLNMEPASRLAYEDLLRGAGIEHVRVFDPGRQLAELEQELSGALGAERLEVIIVRRPCLLAMKKIARAATASGEKPS